MLLIEITQTVHFANLGNHQPNEKFNDVLKIISDESKFGIVLCYVEYTVQSETNLHFKGTVYTAYGKDCTENIKALFQKSQRENLILLMERKVYQSTRNVC